LRKQSRWRLPTIISALEAHAASTGNGNGLLADHSGNDADRDLRTLPMFAEFDRRFGQLKGIKDLAKRRKAAMALVQLAEDCVQPLYGGLNDCRMDNAYVCLIDMLAEPCGWTTTEVWRAVGERDET
jgi:hypothetical protein